MVLTSDLVISQLGRSSIKVRFGFVCSFLVGKEEITVRKQSTWPLIPYLLSLLQYT